MNDENWCLRPLEFIWCFDEIEMLWKMGMLLAESTPTLKLLKNSAKMTMYIKMFTCYNDVCAIYRYVIG